MKFFIHAIAPFVLLLAVSACGQKGKLVIPVRPPAVSTPYPVAQPTVEDAVAVPVPVPGKVAP